LGRSIPGASGDRLYQTETEWHSVEAFMKRFHLLRRHMDFVSFTVGEETRTITLGRGDRGVRFAVPKQSRLGLKFLSIKMGKKMGKKVV